jgi:hypothetical protein
MNEITQTDLSYKDAAEQASFDDGPRITPHLTWETPLLQKLWHGYRWADFHSKPVNLPEDASLVDKTTMFLRGAIGNITAYPKLLFIDPFSAISQSITGHLFQIKLIDAEQAIQRAKEGQIDYPDRLYVIAPIITDHTSFGGKLVRVPIEAFSQDIMRDMAGYNAFMYKGENNNGVPNFEGLYQTLERYMKEANHSKPLKELFLGSHASHNKVVTGLDFDSKNSEYADTLVRNLKHRGILGNNSILHLTGCNVAQGNDAKNRLQQAANDTGITVTAHSFSQAAGQKSTGNQIIFKPWDQK